MRETLERALDHLGERGRQTEIAFFGGSFTAIDRAYMLSLLNAAQPYLPWFYGIRISTRPDCIDGEVLDVLKDYGVTSIELGAQSMDGRVLELNRRGHTAQDVADASALIRERGFSLGLQMMTGLYGASPETDLHTAREFIGLRPDTVRVYPTVIMKDTDLAHLYLSGGFVPYSLETSVSLCAELILMFAKADIALIRLGLHYSESLAGNSLGGNYHPAFKELCENKIFLDRFFEQASKCRGKPLTVTVAPKSLSKLTGQKKSNLKKIRGSGYEIEIKTCETFGKYDIEVCDAIEIS